MSLFALTLVLIAAFTHASWNLLAKRAGGGVTFLWMAAVAGVAIFLPLCFLAGVFSQVVWDLPTAVVLLGSGLLQMLYFVTLQRGYQVGDLSLVYPLARGTGPFFATLAAVAFLGERPTPQAFAGACMIMGGVFAMAFTAPRTGLNRRAAIGFGLATGLCIACYTLWDKVAVSTLLIPPLLLDTSTVLLRAVVLAPVALRNRSTVAVLWRDHKWAVIGVGLLSELAYLLVLTAMQTTPVSYVAPAREISILIGTIMGARLLAEGHLRQRLVAAGAIVIGVVALALG
jgi:drug/metabolite transporter (DMT)-like permease